MTGLLDEIKDERRTRGRRRRLDEILAALSDADAADLKAALDDHTISGVSITRVLEKRGHKFSSCLISKYRLGYS